MELTADGTSARVQLYENAYRFVLSGASGMSVATVFYPLDVVKTHLQNQRTVLYRNELDCFRQLWRKQGARTLYRGLIPQLVGATPVQATKLTVFDFVRQRLSDPVTGHLSLGNELVASVAASVSQVVFHNPLDIVKIRMQTAAKNGKHIGAWGVVRELGFRQLFLGWQACMCRDVLYSVIFFPTYSRIKSLLASEDGQNKPLDFLAAGCLACFPAAALCTPIDVIKTRLQVKPRPGQTQYSGIRDAAAKIWRQEGAATFWKGTMTRVTRSSLQFGCTIALYECLQQVLRVDMQAIVK